MKALDSKWFESCWEQARNRAGNRYTPDLDVSLSIYECFEAIGQDPSFFDRFDSSVSELRKSVQRFPGAAWAHATSENKSKAAIELLDHSLQTMLLLSALRERAPIQLPVAHASKTLKDAEHVVQPLLEEFRAADNKKKGIDETQIEYVVDDVEKLLEWITDIEESITGSLWNAANSKKLLVLGPAGTGKTHLFCEMTQRRINMGLPSLLFLGQSLRAPFNDALQLLTQSIDPGVDPKELVVALDECARKLSTRCVIAIDAINEGDRNSWVSALPALIDAGKS